MEKYLQELSDYFYSIFEHHEVSTIETSNSMMSYLKEIFKLSQKDVTKYDITIKPKNLSKHHDTQALLTFPYNDNETYVISISKNLLNMKNQEDLSDIIFGFFSLGHEIKHILQYELEDELMLSHYLSLIEINEQIERYEEVENKKVVDNLKKLLNNLSYISPIEQDCDDFSYKNLIYILKLIQEKAHGDFKNFMNLCLELCYEFQHKTKTNRKRKNLDKRYLEELLKRQNVSINP